MSRTEGLSLFEHGEADKRPDLFFPRSKDESLGTSQRLIPGALYMAYRHTTPATGQIRKELQAGKWRITNPCNQLNCVASLVDWGPALSTGRDFDLSPGVFNLLKLKTDDIIEVERII